MGERRSKGGAGTVMIRRKKAEMPSITASDHGYSSGWVRR
jgi:hypothetical protein